MYAENGFLQRLNRILGWSFPVGRWFGIEIRVYGAFVIVPLMAASLVWGFPGISPGEVTAYALIETLLLSSVIVSHELSHAWMAWRYRIPASKITLSPLGGLAHLQAAAPSPMAEIQISLAGPAVHVVWLAIFWPLSRVLPPSVGAPEGWVFLDPVRYAVDRLVLMNVWLALFNLLPFLPLDGGRVFRSLLALRMHPNLATIWAARVGTVGAIGFGVAGILTGAFYGGILVAIGIVNYFTCRQEILVARYGEGPYGAARDPWESDPDAWKRGGDVDDETPRPGLWSRFASKLARKPRPVARPDGAPDDAELDRLLAKVGEVGITGLSRSERAALNRASAARRH